jgi:hypothetical protein
LSFVAIIVERREQARQHADGDARKTVFWIEQVHGTEGSLIGRGVEGLFQHRLVARVVKIISGHARRRLGPAQAVPIVAGRERRVADVCQAVLRVEGKLPRRDPVGVGRRVPLPMYVIGFWSGDLASLSYPVAK